ncbi:MAG: hypothetical protein EP347_09455 [Alphaproteobacteria bacterium]|nr:MAG: hypothetical protein EP347_09455 [Alphaproteobacteria bacterium]
MKDAYTLDMTAMDAEAVRAYDAYVQNLLSYGVDYSPIFKAAALSPDNAFLNAHAAAVHMSLEATSGYEAAIPFVEALKENVSAANARERLFCEAVLFQAAQRPRRALEKFLELAVSYPDDIAAIKWGQTQAFNLGHAEALLALGTALTRALPEAPYAQGMLAFGLEQMNDLAGAEAAARRAVAIQSDDAWAHHALAHVFETDGRIEDGLAFLKSQSTSWDDKGVFIREHNWWHMGLYLLDLDRKDEALANYDAHLWGEWPEFGQEQIGAVSMLWRMELRGVDVGGRWQSVAEKVLERGAEHLQPFHDIHFAFALSRLEDEQPVHEFLTSLEAHSKTVNAGMEEVWQKVCLPAAKGVAAYGRGEMGAAYNHMTPIMSELCKIGGSHAQRDLFEQCWLDAGMKCGEKGAVRHRLEERVRARPNDLFAKMRV